VRVRDEFIAIASHELRTPLTPLLLELGSALDLLRRCAKSEGGLDKLEAKLGNCLRHTERLTTLIASMLDVTQIRGGGQQGDPTQLDLRDVVASVLDRMRQPIASSKSFVRFHADDSVLGVWDLKGIETIATNLLTNALKFGRGRPIEITVERFGEVARLTVTDQGIGIAPEKQSRIFERFERAVPSQHYGGFGVGLWVARQVAEAHGGSIRVSSTEGIGSTFVVELPALPQMPRRDTVPYRAGSSPSTTSMQAIRGIRRDSA
jgi:signal transduction histidine kinase